MKPMVRVSKPVLICLFCLVAATHAQAQSCRSLTDTLEFCADGTGWEDVPLVLRPNNQGKAIIQGQKGLLWIIFSKAPESALEELPSLFSAKHKHAQAAMDGFAGLMTNYGGAQELERFSPLGDDVAAASLATHEPKTGWLNVYTFYFENDAELSLQTGIQGVSTLSDEHRDLHLQAVRALREKQN
ncbi:MAG: hypothetical protein AB3N11_12080 [Arenibacterium sp.]